MIGIYYYILGDDSSDPNYVEKESVSALISELQSLNPGLDTSLVVIDEVVTPRTEESCH